MKKIYFSLLLCFGSLIPNAKAQTSTYAFTTGVVQNYTVPAGASVIAIDMSGAQAGAGDYGNSGKGGRIQCTLNVLPLQVYGIYVGNIGIANGANTGTWGMNGTGHVGGNGVVSSYSTGGGGGSTEIYLGSTIVLVAGGGGSTGGDCTSDYGGPGGGTVGGNGEWCGAYSSTYSGAGGNTLTGTGGAAASAGCGATAGTFGSGGNGGESCTNWAGAGGAGYYGGGGSADYGGGGGGSSYPAAAGGNIVAISHTQGYKTGAGSVTITVLCSPAGSIVGAAPVCPGSTITLTNPTAAGGTWISSNPAVATINAATGVLTGVAAGTTTVTYNEGNPCGGVPATASVTVLPVPGSITGTTNACTGFSTTLSDGGVGTWVSSNPAVATVSSSGVVSGLTAGTTTISYTLSSGCAPATTPVIINTFPPSIGGTLSACASGGTTALSDALSGGTWNSTAASVATVGAGSGIVTGVTAGTATISYTAPTGCVTSSVVTINPLPAAIGGTASVCVGSTTTLTDATPGGTWSSSNTSQATIGIGSGVVTGVVSGTPNIIYTLAGTGCRATAPVVVNSLPAAISGSSNACVGSSTPLSDAGGGTWTSSNTAAATINAFTGSVTGVAPGTTTITYTLGTGCSTSLSMLVNPVPAPYPVTGGGNYCQFGSGVHVGLSYGSSGVSYVLYNGFSIVSLPVAGSNSGLDFGLETGAGTYTVVGTNTLTGCVSNMAGSVTVSVNPLPNAYNIIGGGGYCVGTTGSSLGTDGSDAGIQYQLYNGSVAVGPIVTGTGSSLSFGNYTATGTYTVLATNAATGCSQWQGSTATITITPGPTAYTVTGGGSYCAGTGGVNITLNGSDAGTSYQLFYGGTVYGIPAVLGTGTPISFGMVSGAGTYTVEAVNPSGCPGNMSGSATVVINPLPAINTVTGGGGYCAGSPGVHIGLTFSTPGINYQLIYGGGVVTTVGGSGSGLDFGAQTVGGTYTVVAVNSTTLCSSNMAGGATVTMNALPFSFDVLGGGSYCSGGAGQDIYTDGSESGVNYQLYKGGTASGLPMTGLLSGSGLDFGLHTAPGSYTVMAVNSTTGCSMAGTGSAGITINPLPAVHTVTGGGNYCSGGAGVDLGISGSATGVFYELVFSGGILTNTSGTGSALDLGIQSAAGVYTVVAMDSATGCSDNMSGSASIGINPLPVVNTVTGGGSYCAGGTGFAIGLNGSSTGISYQLSNSGTPVGAALSGSGSSLSFGMKTAAGSYTVLATNTLTGCTSMMSGSAMININALPAVETMGGGGNYCAGGSGVDVNMSGSENGVSYQLYRNGSAVGSPVTGTGALLDFGVDTFGVYTATASNGCVANMLGSITVNTVSPVVYTVTGGGHYCMGGTGVTIGQGGSAIGVSYQLMSGGTDIGLPLSGTGTALDFGLITAAGTYTIQATDATLDCIANMAGSATVGIYSLPAAENVTGGGSFCAGTAGAPVGLDNSASGVNYQLYNGTSGTGSALSGITGTALAFGMETTAGTYTVRATDVSTGCTNIMAGNAIITVIPTPTAYAVTVDNYGNYCAADSGLHIWVANSQAGDNYQLFRGSTLVGTAVTGTGTTLDMGLQTTAGSYTVVGADPSTTCVANMLGSAAVNIIPLPVVHNVTGGGGFCPGSAGVPVGLDGSDVGIYYQLYKNTDSLVNTIYGTGAALDYGLQPDPGIYTIVGNNNVPGGLPCQNNMLGDANAFNDTVLTPGVTIRAFPGTGVGVWHIDSMKAYVTNGGSNPTYQWYINGHAIAGATGATFTNYQFFNNDIVACEVTASGPCGGNTTTSSSLTITLSDVGVSQVSAAGGNISLVPNPNKGIFTVKGSMGITTDEEVTMEVTNMLGQVIYTHKVNTVNGSIDEVIDLGNTLANGMYIMSLGSGTQRNVFHFVIEQ